MNATTGAKSTVTEDERGEKDEEGKMSIKEYKAKQFDLSGLSGISDKTVEMHFKR